METYENLKIVQLSNFKTLLNYYQVLLPYENNPKCVCGIVRIEKTVLFNTFERILFHKHIMMEEIL